MTAELLLVRHAAHVHLGQVLTGRLDGVPLSETGAAQARRLGARLARERLDRVETSPRERARSTAGAIAGAAGLVDPQVCPALDEVDFGRWTGVRFDALAGDPGWDEWNAHRATADAPGGESMADAQARIVDHLVAQARAMPGARIALVSHCDMIRAAVAHVLGLSLDHLLRFDIDPASVTRLVVGDWGARVITINERVD